MSSSSLNPPSPPQLQLEPDPGNNSHTPLAGAQEPSNSHGNPQNVHHKVTFGEVLQYWWANVHQSNSVVINSPTPPQIWVAQNVYPQVTPMRILCFSLSLTSFLFAYGSFMETEFYKSTIGVGGGRHRLRHGRPLLFFVAAIGHTVWLIFLLFFGFCSAAYERYRHHYLLKSVGELMVMLLVSLLVLGIGHKHHQEVADAVGAPMSMPQNGEVQASEVAGVAACAFLAIDALCIINLLKPGHHYSLFEATATLTLHLGLVGSPYLSISSVCFVFLILVIKNFLWRHIGHAPAPTNEQHHMASVALEIV